MVTQEPGRRATGALARETLSLPAPRPLGWAGSGRCWSTRASSHYNLRARRQAASRHCRSNLLQEQMSPGLRSTGVVAASAAGLWSSLPRSPAESQPLCRSPKERNALKAAARGARQPVRVSPGRVSAGRRGADRPKARARPGPLPRRGLPVRDSATRRREAAQAANEGARRAGGRGGEALPARLQGLRPT